MLRSLLRSLAFILLHMKDEMRKKKEMKTKYKVKLFNNFTEPYWTSDDPEKSPITMHKCIDEYVAYDEKVFRDILDGFLDAPKKALTEKDIRKDFDINREPRLSSSRVEAIKTYYNGRLALKKKVDADLAKIDVKKLKVGFPKMLKYNIPFEMNYFSCEDNDPCDKLTKMTESYIEIEISNEE